jgi:flagellar biosynthesis chaperone FliJ
MRALEAEADRLRALVTQAHVEAKKLEHLIALEDAREAEAARRAETAALDELATLRAARKG